ncbi:SlyX family protein [uncultured Treponema sp.]|uniref:SlyX family protein n=1 Tax=uncultured Treponema sp. TaxID=162155 RepID=UPI0015B89517|nr:SlyX family protein [uncultured Treponema sp.]
MDTETENRFIALETKLAFMDDFVNKLQQEVVKQQKMIEILREENKILSSRIMDLSENIEIPNRKPPHY